jgi:hypothetical protein
MTGACGVAEAGTNDPNSDRAPTTAMASFICSSR